MSSFFFFRRLTAPTCPSPHLSSSQFATLGVFTVFLRAASLFHGFLLTSCIVLLRYSCDFPLISLALSSTRPVRVPAPPFGEPKGGEPLMSPSVGPPSDALWTVFLFEVPAGRASFFFP